MNVAERRKCSKNIRSQFSQDINRNKASVIVSVVYVRFSNTFLLTGAGTPAAADATAQEACDDKK